MCAAVDRRIRQQRTESYSPKGEYSADTVGRSEPKVSKPFKGEIGGIGIRSPRVGGTGGMGESVEKYGKSVRTPRVGETGGWPRGPRTEEQ